MIFARIAQVLKIPPTRRQGRAELSELVLDVSVIRRGEKGGGRETKGKESEIVERAPTSMGMKKITKSSPVGMNWVPVHFGQRLQRGKKVARNEGSQNSNWNI